MRAARRRIVPDADRVHRPRRQHRHGARSRTSVGRVASATAATASTTQRTRSRRPCAKPHFIAAASWPRRSEPPCEVDMRAYVGPAGRNRSLDIRGRELRARCMTRTITRRRRHSRSRCVDKGNWGLVYRSVRHAGGECIAAFKPQAVSIPVAGAALAYVWDGERISEGLREVGSAVRALIGAAAPDVRRPYSDTAP